VNGHFVNRARERPRGNGISIENFYPPLLTAHQGNVRYTIHHNFQTYILLGCSVVYFYFECGFFRSDLIMQSPEDIEVMLRNVRMLLRQITGTTAEPRLARLPDGIP
jgi:hypothetical protein